MSLLSKAKTNINARKKNAEADAFLLRESLSRFPDFSAADALFQSLLFDASKEKMLRGSVSAPLQKELSSAEQALDAALAAHGKTRSDLSPQYLCPRCKDTGYADGALCDCLKQELNRLIAETGDRPVTPLSEFPTDFPNCAGDDRRVNENAVEILRRWADAFPSVTKNIVTLSGQTGVGKSHLASIVFNRLTAEGYTAVYINAQALNDLFLSDYLGTEPKSGSFAEIKTCDLLVVDDLGAESVKKKVTVEYFYSLLTAREHRPTLFTTNLTADAVAERYGDRVFSRLFDRNNSIGLMLKGEDLRRIKH